MPVYEYQHVGKRGPDCAENFEMLQAMSEEKLSHCPKCGEAVQRLVCMPGISTPHTNAELKNLGFTKLVKRDDGVYENVTRTDKEKRYMTRGDASSLPDIKSKITD